MVIFQIYPLHRHQARDLLPQQLLSKLTRSTRKLRAIQLYNWLNPSFHGWNRVNSIPNRLRFSSSFKVSLIAELENPNHDRGRIKAHLNSRPSLRKVIIWNRTTEKASNLAMEFRNNPEFEHIVFESYIGGLDDIIGDGDIVCSATKSETALVKGPKLKKGAHLNLVGSFKESMKECDDEAIRRGRVK